MSGRVKNLKDRTFGRLVVLEFAGLTDQGSAKWRCRCSCGGEAVVRGSNLSSGMTKSCGCLLRNRSWVPNRKHGRYAGIPQITKEGRTLAAMIQRCYDPGHPRYHIYGGQGVEVCQSWRYSFEDFLADMGPCPGPGYSIDRIDPSGHYQPGNCRWITKAENSARSGLTPSKDRGRRWSDGFAIGWEIGQILQYKPRELPEHLRKFRNEARAAVTRWAKRTAV